MRAEREHHHNATRIHRDRESQWVENLLLKRSIGSLSNSFRIGVWPGGLLIQQTPSHGGQHQSTGDLHDGKGNAEEREESCSHQLDDQEKQGGTDRNLTRQRAIDLVRRRANQAEEYKGGAQRIHNRQQGAKGEAKEFRKLGSVAHGAQQHSTGMEGIS